MSIFMADTVERPSPKAKRMLLAKRVAGREAVAEALREQHANTLTWIKCEPPDAVVFAASTAGGHRGGEALRRSCPRR